MSMKSHSWGDRDEREGHQYRAEDREGNGGTYYTTTIRGPRMLRT